MGQCEAGVDAEGEVLVLQPEGEGQVRCVDFELHLIQDITFYNILFQYLFIFIIRFYQFRLSLFPLFIRMYLESIMKVEL